MKKVKNNLIKPGERYAVVNDIYPPKWSIIELHPHGGYTHVQLWNTRKAAIRAINENRGVLSEYIHPEYRPAATPSPLPETAKTVKVKDGGKVKMNDEETAVWWDEEWHEIQEDQDGEFYFLFNGKTWYIEHPNALPETETEIRDKSLKWWTSLDFEKMLSLRDNYFPGKNLLTADERLHIYLSETETGVSIDTPTEADGVGDYRPETPETGAKYYNYPHLYESLTPGNERQDSGEGLPETIDVHSTGLFEFKAELHPINDPDGMQVLADVSTLNFAEELAKRYNNYPAMYRALKWMLKIAKGKLNENKKTIELRFEKDTLKTWAKDCEAIFNSITGGK